MARVTVLFTVSVYAIVDTDEGTVEKVVVDDENRSAAETFYIESKDGTLVEFSGQLTEAPRKIVEDPLLEWPSWQFGW